MVKPYLGKAATTYEQNRKHEKIWGIEDEILEELLDRHCPESVLDIPVGTGRFLETYERRGIECYGIDLSSDMLELAKKKQRNAILRKGDILDIPLADNSVDMVVCFRLMYFLNLSQVTTAWRELTRVARKVAVVSARFTHPGGPKAKHVITHPWKSFSDACPWNIPRRHLVKERDSDEYVVCEAVPD